MSQPEQGALELNTTASIAQELESRSEQREAQEANDGSEEERQAPSETEAQADETVLNEENDESEQDSEQDSDESEQSDPDAPEEDEEGTGYETLNDLAEALDMPLEDFLGTIKGRVKVNGEEYDVTLSEAMKGYQMEADYRRKTSELAEQRKAFESEQSQNTEQLQTALNQVDLLLTNEEQALQAEYQAVNWDELEQVDREDYLIKKSKFQDRYQALQQNRQQALQQAAQLQQQQQAEQQAQLRELIQREAELLSETIPEWNNVETKQKQQAEVRDYLVERGFSESEILTQVDGNGNIVHPGLIDHRVLPIILDAMKYRQQGDEITLAKKKVKKLPPIVRAGNKQTSKERRQVAKQSTTEQFMKTGSRDDLIKVLLDRSN